MAYTKECVICGKTFISKYAKTKGCSEACRKRYNIEYVKKKYKEKRTIKKCVMCGKEFEATPKKIYCSIDCQKSFVKPVAVKEKKRKKEFVSLAEMQRRARELGMSYGKYVVEMEKKNGE